MSDPDGVDVFQYDALDRLKKVTREVGGVAVAVEDYDYNALGALKLNAGVPLAHQRPRLDGAGLADAAVPATLGGQAVTLDAGGRVTSLRGTSFTWSAQGFVRQAQDPVPAAAEQYGIDSNLRRISKTQGASSEVYVFEGLDRVATLAQTGAVKDGYLFDGIDHPLRIKVAATNTTAYYELDLAGNVRGLRASGGASLGGYRYSAFGTTLEDTTTITRPLRWKGRWFSPVAGGTYDVRARQWSPELGVFLSVDEYWAHDVRSTLWGWGRQNPITFSDPTGHLPWGPPNPPPVPPTPPTKPWCPADDPDRDQCRKDCDADHDADHDACKYKKTPKEKEQCHSEANEKYSKCLSKCPPL
jgi:RHS repeat-associated protein